MSTLILNPLSSYFSPFSRRVDRQSHPIEAELRAFRAGPTSVPSIYLNAILKIVLGAGLFLASAVPTLLFFLLSAVMAKNGLADTSPFALVQLAGQACLGIDLFLFLLYSGRTLLGVIRFL